LVVLVILVAPTIAGRLEQLNPDNADKQGNPTTQQKRRGIVYRAVRRFGPRQHPTKTLYLVPSCTLPSIDSSALRPVSTVPAAWARRVDSQGRYGQGCG